MAGIRRLIWRWLAIYSNQPDAGAMQKLPLSCHLALFRGGKRQPRNIDFDQCLRGYEGWWALLDLNQ